MTNREKFMAAFRPGDSPSRVAAELGLNRGSCIRWAKDAMENSASTTLYDAEGRVKLQWVRRKPDERAKERVMEEYVNGLVSDIDPCDPVDPPTDVNEDLCACYIIPDSHIGMLAWGQENGGKDYDISIAEHRLIQATHELSLCSHAERALVVFLGDMLHYDGYESVTPTNKNQLDTDTRFPKLAETAARVMRFVIDKALLRHERVDVIVESGNHDPASGVWLRLALDMFYSREPRVDINMSPRSVHYWKWGKNLIGTNHGRTNKLASLPLVMANDVPQGWADTTYRSWWLGDKHRAEKVAYPGCYVERFETLASPDAYADSHLWRPHQSMTMIVLHKEHGEWSRHTVRVVDKH